jgi:hypothetical protein
MLWWDIGDVNMSPADEASTETKGQNRRSVDEIVAVESVFFICFVAGFE